MKQFLVLVISCVFFQLAAAQNEAPDASVDPARAATEQLTLKYKLEPKQAKEMYTIQARKFKNLAEVATLKAGDPVLYRKKIQNIQKGTLNSIRRLISRHPEQIAIYDQTQKEIRTLRAQKRKEMALQAQSPELVEAALLDIYAE